MSKKKWKRVGQCNKCGECCRYVGTRLGNDEGANWLRFSHPGRIKRIDGIDYYVVPDPCIYLDVDSGLCTIYSFKRPRACAEEPSSPEWTAYKYTREKCGFRFEEIK